MPGAGKSTFSIHLTAADPGWERVNQAHAVIFDLPAALRASQVMRRDSGKGCVEGLGARRVVRMTCTMIRELRTTPPYRIENYPSLSEGLQSIIVCNSHDDIAHAQEVWKHPPVGPYDPEAAFRSRHLIGRAAISSERPRELGVENCVVRRIVWPARRIVRPGELCSPENCVAW